MMVIITWILGIGMPVAAFFYTIAKDKRDGVNGW